LWAIDFGGFYLGQQGKSFSTTSFGNPALGRPIIDQSPLAGAIVNGVPVMVPNARLGLENAERVAFPGTVAGTVSANRTSNFWGAEANLRRNLVNSSDWNLDFLVGYRMLGLDESLGVSESLVSVGNQTVPAGTTFQINDRFATSNRFYGAQIGVDGEYRLGAWSFGSKIKVGMGDTQQIVDVTGNTRIVTPPPFNTVMNGQGGLLALPGTNIGHYHREMFGVVPEAAFTIGYQITPRLQATLGYNFLYWSSVARPGEQIDRNVNRTFQPFAGPPMGAAKPAFPFAGSDFWAQGLTVGLTYKW
jgi:hypothetical protein